MACLEAGISVIYLSEKLGALKYCSTHFANPVFKSLRSFDNLSFKLSCYMFYTDKCTYIVHCYTMFENNRIILQLTVNALHSLPL